MDRGDEWTEVVTLKPFVVNLSLGTKPFVRCKEKQDVHLDKVISYYVIQRFGRDRFLSV